MAGPLTWQPNQSFTSGGTTSTYHLDASGVDLNKRVGLILYTDGSGEYGLKNINDTYLLAGANGLRNVAARQNMILLTPLAPGNGCTDGDGTCWYMSSYDGTTIATKLAWTHALVLDVLNRYPEIDRARVIIGGYSSGAQFTMEYYGPQYASTWMIGGVLVGISYGGSPKGTTNFPAAFKQNVFAYWNVGANDSAYNGDGSYSAKAGYDWYTANGFNTKLDLIAGLGHNRSDFGQVVEAQITTRLPAATATTPPPTPPPSSGGAPVTVLFNQPMTGTQGATITTATLAAAGDAPDLFQNPAPAVWFYDNGMGKLEANSTASYLQENVSFTEGQDLVAYIGTWRASNPPTTLYMLRVNNGGSLVARLSLGTDRIVKMYSATGTEWTDSTAVPLDRKVIHGLRIRPGATTGTGQLEYRRWEATAGAPTVTPNVLAAPVAQVTVPVATGTAATRVQFGNTAASNTASTWFHNLRVLDGWDSASVKATAPATAAVGSTVSLSAVGSPTGGTFSWARAATPGDAPAISLTGASSSSPSFTVPAGAGGKTANFTVTYTPSGLAAVTDTVSVAFAPGVKPVVSYTRSEGTVINATATAGTVTLTQVGGTGVTVTQSPTKVWTIDTTGVDQELRFQLVANDGTQDSDPAFVDVSPTGGDTRVSAERYFDTATATWQPTRV